MRSPATSRRWTLLAAGIGLALFSGPAMAAVDTNRFFIEMSEAETIAQRAELCSRITTADAPPYLTSFCQAILALANRSDSLAVLLLDDTLRLQPDFSLGPVVFGDTYLEQSELVSALRWYERARSLAPERLGPLYGIGRVWLARGEKEDPAAYEKALDAFREMTRIDPQSIDGWANVGMILAILQRFDEAEASYRRALALEPQNPDLYESIGAVAARRGDEAAAEDLWKKALNIDPAQATTSVELAALYGRQGKIREAIGLLEHGVKASHVGPAAGRLRRDLALICLLEENPARAGELLEEARILSPDPRTLAALSHVKMLDGRTAEAVALLAEAAVKDSAAAAPFLRAWTAQIVPVLGTIAETNPAGFSILRKLAARSAAAPGEAGALATGSLVASLLPDWKLPKGRLDVRGEAQAEEYDTPPVPVYRAMAVYPETAAGIEGMVQVRVKIDAQGNVREAKLTGEGGNPALEWAALDAAKRWRFKPAMRNGRPVESEVTIPFRFSRSR